MKTDDFSVKRRWVSQKLKADPNSVLDAMDPNGATMKQGEIAAVLLPAIGLEYQYAIGLELGAALQRLKRAGDVEFVIGPGSGWRISENRLAARKARS